MTRALCLTLSLLLAPAWGQTVTPVEPTPRPLKQVERMPGLESPLRRHIYGKVRRIAAWIPALRGLRAPTAGTLRLGVVLVEFPDQARPERFSDPQHWADMLFGADYTQTATGEPAYGSMAAYYRENSGGRFDIQGQVFDWVMSPRPRAELETQPGFGPGSTRSLFVPALDAVAARDGRAALEACDVFAFVLAGGWGGRRGSVTWPHAAVVFWGGKTYNFYAMHAGTTHFEPIGVHCHEMGHTLGILDKYGVGSDTGLGQWCAMSSGAHGGRPYGIPLDAPIEELPDVGRRVLEDQLAAGRKWLEDLLGLPKRDREARPAPPRPSRQRSDSVDPKPVPRTEPGQRRYDGNERPMHFCAACKARLGWTQPTAVDPRTTTRLYLTPIERDVDQVLRIPLDPRGKESLYLEYRTQQGFDHGLPRSGLLVWRTGSPTAIQRNFVPLEQCELIPAHGQDSIDAAHRDPGQIMFPTAEVTSATISGTREGAWTVELRGIREADGRLYLEVGPAN